MAQSWTTFGIDLHLDLDTAHGRRTGLEQGLRDAIRDGRLAPRTRLPSTRALAAELGLARGTVSTAYEQLIAEGYLVARRGSGTAVAVLPRQTSGGGRTPMRVDGQRRPGDPDLTAFPVAGWLRATRRALAAAPAEAYYYGDPRGRIELRSALADYLGRTRGVLASPDQIIITSGYLQALALLAQVLRERGTTAVAMEDPGVRFHQTVVARAGLRVLPLPVDESGARTDLLRDGEIGGEAGAVVVTPAHQYPTGATLHPARRHTLAQWARARGGLVIEDDYDGEFRYDRQPVGSVQGTAPDQVAYVGSASKTLGPALRLGWLVLPHHLVDAVADAKLHHDHHTETIGQLTLAEFITGHDYDRHIRASRLRYRKRRDLLLARLQPTTAVRGAAAGLHAMISLPPGGPDEAAVLARTAGSGLPVTGLAEHWHDPGADHPPGVVVGYAACSDGAYPAALDTLGRALMS
ncbi:GntR family transcriptional regulator/MocR family aminotransferase [Allocatelliglobosispora scoriae]|uniref:GntR family transcriptional regulator/MocR family aminotransferase n=1 Tax=Allocatelliglobosispora scoriae TaxID=643052 RepID=A0A841BLR7_9ACTN|nr:PLP-dependent aminotransferase family protein [Allocatelliglobosispora scoriae]MBB5868196.1 GntR family transcriptional regulator/MocR family aminotransferase [Allocatelliglobosispora scoriae]